MKKETGIGVQPENRLSISVPQAAKLLSVSKPTVYALAQREDFPAFQVGNRILVSVAGLAAWVDRQAEQKAG